MEPTFVGQYTNSDLVICDRQFLGIGNPLVPPSLRTESETMSETRHYLGAYATGG